MRFHVTVAYDRVARGPGFDSYGLTRIVLYIFFLLLRFYLFVQNIILSMSVTFLSQFYFFYLIYDTHVTTYESININIIIIFKLSDLFVFVK